ncbi:MAG TPA: J domain-containing protein, partial [bacterium]|nr:J domain-containing protein [bacterium]
PDTVMSSLGIARTGRVLGDGAVLERLARLGREPRLFPNMIRAGFPPEQLAEARDWYIRDASTALERYASQQLARGFFEDETLLALLCRFYACTDWRLENSPWFFSAEDYQRFFHELVGPVDFATAQLEAGLGEERWGGFFLKLPFDLGMEQALRSLWTDIAQRDHYWKAQAGYTHLRAEALYQYLLRTLDVANFTADFYHYHWERDFRGQLHGALQRFRHALEDAARRWEEQRRERMRTFAYHAFGSGPGLVLRLDVLQALAYLGLEREALTPRSLRAAFRQRSKQSHPDHGGSEEAFQELARHRQVLEDWLEQG